jgi:hypothetical protein
MTYKLIFIDKELFKVPLHNSSSPDDLQLVDHSPILSELYFSDPSQIFHNNYGK